MLGHAYGCRLCSEQVAAIEVARYLEAGHCLLAASGSYGAVEVRNRELILIFELMIYRPRLAS